MNTNTTIKKDAQIAWNNGNKIEAYRIAWQLPINELYNWLTKNKKRLFFSKEFYSDFLTSQNANWLQNPHSHLLIEYYFSKKWFIETFESFLLYNRPQHYIDFVKSSFGFLNTERLTFLNNLKGISEDLKEEIDKWNYFFAQHNDSWQAVVLYFDNSKEDGLDLLLALIVAFESRYYEIKSAEDIQYSGDALSLLIAYIQHKNLIDFSKTPEIEVINKKYFSILSKNEHESLFLFGLAYIQTRENIIRYALEDGLQMKMMGSSEFSFIESEKFNKQWHKDGVLYARNEEIYDAYGRIIARNLEEREEIKYVNNIHSVENKEANTKLVSIDMALSDLGLLDKDIPNNRPKLNHLTTFLNLLGKSKFEKQVKPLLSFKVSTPNITYKQAFINRMLELEGIGIEPLLMSKPSILSKIATGSGNPITENEMNNLIKDFSFDWCTKDFDPFNMPLSMWQKPFLRLGTLVVSPIGIISAFSGLYTITESILKNYTPKDGRVIEQILKNYLIRWDDVWKVNTNWQEDNGIKNGDADVVLEDNEYIVLMQLKRTSQKINLRQQLAQVPQDRKAISQLTKAQNHLIKQGEKRIIKLWYVTTAMEKIGVVENGVIRVNYQEILHLLRSSELERKDFLNLKNFIVKIEQ
ncbi:hypothetical protein [Polaribacter sp. OB-PA-B3]